MARRRPSPGLFPTTGVGPSAPDTRPEINYPLVETTRPQLYRAMKYWGKKPHNIWAQYIDRYCPPGGVVADPFSGSGVAAFEAVQLGRKAIAFDLNPLTAFFIEVTASGSRFDEDAFLTAARRVREAVENTTVYGDHYRRTRDGQTATVLNYRWERERLSGVAIQRPDGTRKLLQPDATDLATGAAMAALPSSAWCPQRAFPAHPSVNHRFLADIGGGTIDHLWTRRNLILLSLVFQEIAAVADTDIRLQLLSAFVQSAHLCTKMVIPRNEAANREFSGSWGRPDYLVRRRRMEQNPVDVFWRSCAGRQGVIPMMRDAAGKFPNGLDIHDARAAGKLRKSADINYGSIDVADLDDYLGAKSVDFFLTDPPYAGLVRYMPLSVVWLGWLEHIDRKYTPDLQSEITVEPGSRPSRDNYRLRLRNAFERVHRALKDNGRLVVTFHHQKVSEFNDFARAVRQAGFVFDKVTHQYNRRSGESNVANPYGVSGSDFYIRCVKRRDINFAERASELGTFVLQQAIEIIGRRGEQTPYTFLFEALWPELLQAGFTQPSDSHDEVKRILDANEGAGRIFFKTPNPDARVGDLWWFNEPAKYISHPDRPLQDRVAESVLSILRRKVSVTLDDVIADLFREYPNGLTPDPRTVGSFLSQYAYRSQGKWKISPDTIIDVTRHTGAIENILAIGRKMGTPAFVGRREQPERTSSGQPLRDLAAVQSLDSLSGITAAAKPRLEMVDVVFLTPGRDQMVCLWEVENSTNFASAILRGSNAPAAVPKFMVVPDKREAELLAFADPLFRDSFRQLGWRYLTYTAAERLAGFSTPTLDEVTKTANELPGGGKGAH